MPVRTLSLRRFSARIVPYLDFCRVYSENRKDPHSGLCSAAGCHNPLAPLKSGRDSYAAVLIQLDAGSKPVLNLIGELACPVVC